MESLAVKYRPKTFEDVVGQESTIKILKQEIDTGTFVNAYLFCGSSGCGKTTTARIFADAINKGAGSPIEIDGASNSGVDNVRELIKQAQERSLDSEYKIFVIDECVTGDTEVLTNFGWKRFDSLDKTELIAQYDNGKISFVKPYEYIDMEYEGKMFNVSIGNKATFMFSPNHVQPLFYTKSGKIKEKYVKDTKFCQTNKFIRSGVSDIDGCGLTVNDRLAICLQADGTLNNICKDHNYWTIVVKKERKKNRLIELLSESDFEYKEIKTKTNDAIRFSIKTPTNITKKLCTYFDLSKMSYVFANEFIEELMQWDGYTNDEYLYYSCVDKDNVDFCQCVATMCGYASRIVTQNDNRKNTYNDCFRLYLKKRNYSTTNSHVKKTETDFSGRIYCVKVPSHMIFVRKNGYEMVTGNCHALSSQAWQAFLKTIEEPPKYTIFIFCTTESNKVPKTILNRVQRFNFSRFDTNQICNRLNYILNEEYKIGNVVPTETSKQAVLSIAKMSNGGMRDAVTLLDTCLKYDKNLSVENVSKALGEYSYDTMFSVLNLIVDRKEDELLTKLDEIYNSGSDMYLFVSTMLKFVLDVQKYFITKNIAVTSIPDIYEEELKRFELQDATQTVPYYSYVTKNVLELLTSIKGVADCSGFITIYLLKITRCE